MNCASIVLVVAKKLQMGLDAFHFKQSRGGHLGYADRPKLPNSGGPSGGVVKPWWSIRQAMVETLQWAGYLGRLKIHPDPRSSRSLGPREQGVA